MIIQVNGKKIEAGDGVSVQTFLEEKGVNSSVVACELNLKIIRRAHLGETILKEGDSLEIIQMIGGG